MGMLHIVEFTNNNLEDVKDVLRQIAGCDNDFNGNNGEMYLWKVAKGYDSNCDYLLSNISSTNTTMFIKDFLRRWLCGDDYFTKYDVKTTILYDKIVISLVLCFE